MYAGLVLTKYSGRLMGAHQKIDRVARRHLSTMDDGHRTNFPTIKEILRFEGTNGPDGIKKKSPSHNEPWHFLNPFSDNNQDFLNLLSYHYDNLVTHLKTGNRERAAFEAAWLAHAIVDGLTPAHHFPFDDKINELRGGRELKRDTISKKLFFKGKTRSATIKNTAKVYGPKGLMTAHVMFELGVTLLVRPLRLPDARPSKTDLDEIRSKGYQEYFMNRAREIAALDLYDLYLETGWGAQLSHKIRHSLAPIMVKTVTMLWHDAMEQAK